jgi:hypothetical protein
MGSFYSTCSISDLSIIDSDSTYIQLIVPTWVKNPHSIDGEQIGCGEKGLRVSNEGPLCEFSPFGFPIEGKYADYGNIDNIVPSRNIEMLEEFFGIPIVDIISCATDDRWYRYGYLEPNKQNNSWIIADNKMKNVEILKQLTVTYFRKEHYDFLSEKLLDINYKDERKKHINKINNILNELDKVRPKNSKHRKEFTLSDITDEIREKYMVIRGSYSNSEFDMLIIQMENYKKEIWWKGEWNYNLYIPSLNKMNMFKLLPIGSKDFEEVKKQYIFTRNMGDLYKVIRPSYYGSQSDNFDAYVKFHNFSVSLVNSQKNKIKKDTVLDDISYVLKYTLNDVDNKDVVDIIKNKIVQNLKDNGFDLKL